MVVEVLFWVFVGLVAYAYFGYPALLVALGSLRGKREYPELQELTTVSLLIVAYNEEKVIRQKIENSLALDYPKDKLEIIIASDASTDSTDKIAIEYQDKGVRLIRRPTRGSQTGAQNYAAPQAKGDIIVFSDAETMYARDAIGKLVEPFADRDVGCVVGNHGYINPGDSATSYGETLYKRYDNFLKQKQSTARALLFATGAIYAVRSSLYTPVDPRYDHDTVVPLRCAASGHKVIYQPKAVAYEQASTEAENEFRRKVRIIVRDAWTLLGLKLMFPRLWLTFNIVSHKILRWLVPVFLIAALIMNAFLLDQLLYQVTMSLQILFYLSALLAFLLSQRGKGVKLLRVPFYFCLVNLACLMAIWKVCRGEKVVTWQPRGW
ncbi:MAG: glycosyltransferase family 2 protein [Chloroflexi bacterium]|nr:glycosyltransferase family 2 protein [Chloroflexota bacterium]